MKPNLNELSSTFPEPPETEISRDSMIRLISKRFGEKVERLLLSGPRGSGKTVQLSQFVRHYSSHATQPHINADQLRNTLVPILESIEQIEIANTLRACDSKIAALEKR
jgi:Cdc6-like AAA superfamily ATPase